MAIETEMKVRVQNHAQVEAILRRLQAEPAGEFNQEDLFFDSADRALLASDRGLRLRTLDRIDRPGPKSQYVLTYKGARQASTIKQREEIEVEVTDPLAMIAILNHLGYRLMLHLQKRRRRYRLRDCWVELDTLPLLGCFVEIEGPGECSIAKAAEDLQLDAGGSITDSYASLLMAEAKKRGMPTAPAMFLLDESTTPGM